MENRHYIFTNTGLIIKTDTDTWLWNDHFFGHAKFENSRVSFDKFFIERISPQTMLKRGTGLQLGRTKSPRPVEIHFGRTRPLVPVLIYIPCAKCIYALRVPKFTKMWAIWHSFSLRNHFWFNSPDEPGNNEIIWIWQISPNLKKNCKFRQICWEIFIKSAENTYLGIL